MKFSQKLKKLRKTLGYNQTEFGEMLGLGQEGVSSIERGKKNPSKTLMRYLEYRFSHIFQNCDTASITELESHNDFDVRFQNPDLAKSINQILLEIENIDEGHLREIKGYLRSELSQLKNKTDRRSGEDRRKEDIPELTPEADRRSGQERRVANLNS